LKQHLRIRNRPPKRGRRA